MDDSGNGNEVVSIAVNYREKRAKIIGVGDGIFSFKTDDPANGLKSKRIAHLGSVYHQPFGDLFQASDESIWGMTYETDEFGAIFKMNCDLQSFSFVHFYNEDEGKNITATLTELNGVLWGTAREGVANNMGTIFRINLDGTGFEKKHDFDNTNGSRPGNRLLACNGKLFGITEEGVSDDGVLFSIDEDRNYEVLHEFYESNGYGGLIVVNDRLWVQIPMAPRLWRDFQHQP